MARHGLAWYEVDLNWYGISFLRAIGLVWDVKAPSLRSLEEKAARGAARLQPVGSAAGGDD
jgi:stearoyl-CoA desaturase (delta-9 desaturase)